MACGPKWVVQPKPLKDISFRKAEYGKELTSALNVSDVVTPSLTSLVTSSTADIVGLVSDVQQSVNSSGVTHFRLKTET